jgi:hypothetical protein
MRTTLILLILTCSLSAFGQEERDTTLRRCPVYITDTVTVNNFFLEFQPSTIKVYRSRGRLNILVEQRDQFFTISFRNSKLKNGKYKILVDPNSKNEAGAKYSFRSGNSVSYVDVSSGTIESSFDKEKDHWHLKLNGMLANMVGYTVSYYKVRAEFYIK